MNEWLLQAFDRGRNKFTCYGIRSDTEFVAGPISSPASCVLLSGQKSLMSAIGKVDGLNKAADIIEQTLRLQSNAAAAPTPDAEMTAQVSATNISMETAG